MSIHSEYQDVMVDVLFGEATPEETRELESHLERCDDCAEEFASLQATLQVTAERERPEPPEAFWESYRYRLMQRAEHEARTRRLTLIERLRRWWASLPAVLPQTGGQWALQGAVAVCVLVVGLWLGSTGGPSPLGAPPSPLASGDAGEQDVTDLMLASQPVRTSVGTARPSLAGVRDITYDVTAEVVEIRYRTVTDVVVKGRPEDPKVQRLLQAAMLDERHPSSRLHAVKTLEAASVAPDGETGETVRALRYLAREESDTGMRLRAVRALGSIYAGRPMDDTTRDLLVGILLDAEAPALRIEAMEALTDSGALGRASRGLLYQVRSDSNRYLRTRAEALLQERDLPQPDLQQTGALSSASSERAGDG